MSKFVQILAALSLAAAPLLSMAADPVAEGRSEMAQAKHGKKAATTAAGKEYDAAKAKAKAELAEEKASNTARAKAETAAGKDGLILKRHLDHASNLSYKAKIKAAKEARSAAEAAAKAGAAPAQAAATTKMEQGLKSVQGASAPKN
ncbi:hypothetical protein [Roseateles oligotrophus]|uniref:Uncharacterized protein n=1 Tax=Roseateles oligotrophus TaxID=1769250 RepID=A0ABT2YJ83_9BURK|nr:hypothetical protein [Roseateles oligotrophus]MCV2370134.1 hypothetical protein [Roseateles oligotrophus]